MQGVSLNRWDIPDELIEQYRLSERITRRDNGPLEVQFLYRKRPRLLPVWYGGSLVLMPWLGWCPLEELEAGVWKEKHPKRVDIPATYCIDRGIWYQINEGVQGVIVRRQVYPITIPSSNYYRVMTRSQRMPLLIGEQF
ncbi:MAG: hypothetical protein KDA93_01395 [Planctomycetaceae bacterium]|nr:hypothetical protein [Planctomycetaceae bacterium]